MPKASRLSRASEPAQKWLLWVSVSMITMIAFEALAVTTAMPTVVEDLDGESWYAIANGIVLATQVITTALCGIWADAKGPKPALLTGVGLLASGLLVAALAPSIEIFTLGRFVQGLGGGLCIVPLYVLIGRLVPGNRQPAFFAAFAAAWVLPSLVGPTLSGLIVEHLHWRLVFGIVPIFLLAMIPVMIKVFGMLPPMEFTGSLDCLRPVALAALGAGLGAICLQFISGVDAADFSPIILLGIAGATAVTLACARPLLPPGTLRGRRGVPATVIFRGLLNGTFLAVEMYLPLLLQRVHHWSPTQAGVALTVGSLTWAAGSALQARVHDPAKRERILFVGSSLATLGFAATIPVAFSSVPPLLLVLTWSIAGLGLGLAFPATTTHALALTPQAQHGSISSSLEISATLGASILIAIAGITFAAVSGSGTPAFATLISVIAGVSLVTVWISRRIVPEGKVTDVAPAAGLV